MSSNLRPIARPEYTINKSYVFRQFNHLVTSWLKTYHADQGSIIINPRLSVGKETCIESKQHRQQRRNRKYRDDGNQSRRVRWRIWSIEVVYPAHGAKSVMSRPRCTSMSRGYLSSINSSKQSGFTEIGPLIKNDFSIAPYLVPTEQKV